MDTAQALAHETVSAGSSDARQYLTFLLADAEYGVDILRVQEIKGWDLVTALPNTPGYVRGVMNLRGTIVPIIDLRQRFGLDTIDYGLTTVVVVVRVMHERGSRIMGLVVDAVSDVYNISDTDMRAAPECANTVSGDCVRGLATVHGKMVIILDIDQLLNAGELAVAA
ncbi:MAG: chemotaxis protein CheW [Candidatus Tectimicrobiota bacterium]